VRAVLLIDASGLRANAADAEVMAHTHGTAARGRFVVDCERAGGASADQFRF
jgi:hypothetical protein